METHGISKELKAAAGKMLWQEKWLGRLVSLSIIFAFARYIAQNIASELAGGEATLPFGGVDAAAFGAALRDEAPRILLSLFVMTLMNSIGSFGMAKATLNAADHTDGHWRAGVFGGFRDPVGAFCLGFAHMIFAMWPLVAWGLGALLFVMLGKIGGAPALPGAWTALPFAALCIPLFYRYRMAWRIKAENPEMPARECLLASSRMMNGCKSASFRLDLAHWKELAALVASALALAAVELLAESAGDAVTPLVALALATLLLGFTSLLVYVWVCISLAQTMLYTEIRKSAADKPT